jgi:nucleoside-diphosphate-sugar epimerase
MRIFLTGATGFLGSRVLAFLSGHELLCLSRRSGRRPTLRGVRSISGDLADPTTWQTELQQFAPDCCIHLAWTDLPNYSFSACRANLDSSMRLVETVVTSGATRIIVAGTCWEYGNASGAVKENQPIGDCGVFASTKHALRLMLESFAREAQIEARWVRIFFAYGPHQRISALIPQCHLAYLRGTQPAIRNPEAVQDFVYVDDVARGIVAIAEADAGSGIFNLGSGAPTSVAYVVNQVADHFRVPRPFMLPQSQSGFWADTSKVSAATGWRPQTSIESGIMETLMELDRKQ